MGHGINPYIKLRKFSEILEIYIFVAAKNAIGKSVIREDTQKPKITRHIRNKTTN
jgi:hypothetical protein